MKHWTSEDSGCLTQHQRYGEKIHTSTKPTSAVGFASGLYALQSTTDANRDLLETTFFRTMDDEAARSLSAIVESKGVGLTSDQVVPFIYFLLLLRVRHPEAVELLRDGGRVAISEALAERPEEYNQLRHNSDPSTLLEFVEQRIPGQVTDFGLLQLPLIATDDRLIKRIASMKIRVMNCALAATDLITTDRPCHLTGNLLSDGPCFMAIPASPRVLVLLAASKEILDRVSHRPITELVKRANWTAISGAHQYVYATGSHHLPLVMKNQYRLRDSRGDSKDNATPMRA